MHVLIYSRLNSSRFKNKALTKLSNGKMLIEQVIAQAKNITSRENIILATTTNREDLKLCNIANKNGINYFRGSENNVLARTINCCKKFKIKKFYRYCGDRPFIMTKDIRFYLNKNLNSFDMITNNLAKKKIDGGLTYEIITFNSLKKIYRKKNLTNYDKEHITNFFYKNYNNFKIKKISQSQSFYKGNNYSINKKSDIKFINFLINENFKSEINFPNITKLYEKFATFN